MRSFAGISVVMMLLCFYGISLPFVRADEGNGLKKIEQLVKEAHEGASFISIEGMKERIKKNDKLVLLDVRTKQEYDAAHIKGSAWLERGVAEFVLVRTLPDPDAEIVVYCKAGNRTGLVTKALRSAGYRNVVGLEGGFDEWVQRGNTVHNFLGEFKMVKLAKINASSFRVEFYENKN
ncbi:MAG: rhodanese-like domain-containing protein [Pseudomonadota bacterium]